MSEMAASDALGELGVQYLNVDDLLLDGENPRLPLELRGSQDQTALAINMAEIFDALEVARSMARFGFYPWEAIVVVPTDGRFTVVEGNRRITAMKGLLDPGLRAQFENSEAWHEVAAKAVHPIATAAPCVVVQDRKQATPALGYRHISGIKPWEPQMQARFVTSLVDVDGLSFEEAAELTGQTRLWVQETYSTFKVFETAQEVGVDITNAANAYSLLTVAMSTRELRDHIGAERVTEEGGTAIAEPNREEISELFEWVFGSDEADPVVSESRDIRNLAKVVAKPAGLTAIRNGLSLEEAKQQVDDTEYDPADVIRRDLLKAETLLNRIDLTSIEVTDDLARLLEAVVEQTQRLINELDAEAG